MKKILLTLAVLALFSGTSAFAVNGLDVTAPGGGSTATSYKLEVTCDGTDTSNVYVQSDHPSGETHYLMRFFISPASTSLQTNRSIRIGGVGDAANGQHVLVFLKRNDADNSYRINTWYKDDGGSYAAGPGMFLVFQTNPTVWRQIEVEFTAASAPGANDGSLVVRRTWPSTADESITGLDTDTLVVDNLRIGAIAGSCSRVSGASTYYFDEFESYR